MHQSIYLKLAAGAIALTVAAGTYAYISYLRTKVKELSQAVAQVSQERDAARAQVISLTTSRDRLLARQAEAERQAARRRADLARARDNLQVAQIPSQCDAALNWLAEELR